MPFPILQGLQVALATANNMTQKTGKTPARAPPSPTASFYDVSDEEEQEYSTISHTSSRKGVKLLFSKSKVHVVQQLRLPLYSHPALGLRPSNAFSERQYPRLHCPRAAEIRSFVLRTFCRQFKPESCFPVSPSMGPRVDPRRRPPQHLCQSGYGRQLLSSEDHILRPSSTRIEHLR